MTERVSLALGVLIASGCGQFDPAPPASVGSSQPEIIYLVHNEVQGIRLDGTGHRSLGRVGDDKHRTGFPRVLPDGRIALLADDTGQIFPYVGVPEGNNFQAIKPMNETTNDSLCGVSVAGESRLIFTTTSFEATYTRMQRVDVDDPVLDPVAFQSGGTIQNPAPYSDGRVLAVRNINGTTSIEIMDVSQAVGAPASSEKVLAQPIEMPFFAMSPARLSDGRVVFILVDSRDAYDDPFGEINVVGQDGVPRPTGLTAVASLVVVQDRVVYEAVSPLGATELMATDLSGVPSVNVTNTPYVNEHLAWSN